MKWIESLDFERVLALDELVEKNVKILGKHQTVKLLAPYIQEYAALEER